MCPRCVECHPGAEAEGLGLQLGDRLVAVAGSALPSNEDPRVVGRARGSGVRRGLRTRDGREPRGPTLLCGLRHSHREGWHRCDPPPIRRTNSIPAGTTEESS